jgi:pantoate kinase
MIGAYVTTGARFKLYFYLDALKERTIYCDTESVIYKNRIAHAHDVTCVEGLGDIMNQLNME